MGSDSNGIRWCSWEYICRFSVAIEDPSLDYYLSVTSNTNTAFEPDPYSILTTFQTSQLADETEKNDSINTADIIFQEHLLVEI